MRLSRVSCFLDSGALSMLHPARRALCRVTAQNYKTRITAETRAAIAGLDAAVFGFERAECSGPVPAKLAGSYTMSDHLILNTAMPPTAWAKRYQNVPGFKELEAAVRAQLPEATLTVCHTAEYPAGTVFRFAPAAAETGGGEQLQCTRYAPAAVPLWHDGVPPSSIDCSADSFVLVCAHRSRDARCGYCGPVLADIFGQELRRALPESSRVHVMPCSHFGGHVYAGNVLLYSRHGGVCFGCVTPTDAEALVDMIRNDDGVVPPTLKDRVRGRLMPSAAR
ncbi:Sucrase/ferredoxin-like [Novymonas esmeraldas]|uniref:Sucrase/ferredoxin-like n=1 Tax=Novymonas esmeraldas TaxID=1808958 RepID=A0AAW0EVP3_9TRYP